MRSSPTLFFFARELSNSLRRNPLMLAASIGTATLLVFLLGFFFLLFMNIRQMETNLAEGIEIHAYLKPGISYEEAQILRKQVAGMPPVASVSYVSKEQALSNLEKDVNQQINLSGLMRNPLPAYLSVKAKNPENIPQVSAWLKQQPQVNAVRDLADVVGRLVTFFKTVSALFLGLAILLLFCTLFIIYNTIRLSVLARKKEIEIMQLVGAGSSVVRWPFILEGALCGLIGSALAIFLLVPGYQALAGQLASIFPAFHLIDGQVMGSLFFWLLLTGTLVGSSGGLLSVRRYFHT